MFFHHQVLEHHAWAKMGNQQALGIITSFNIQKRISRTAWGTMLSHVPTTSNLFPNWNSIDYMLKNTILIW